MPAGSLEAAMSLLSRWRFERALAALEGAKLPPAALCALEAYRTADWPQADCPACKAPLLALDFELDGLRRDSHLLQAGWLPFTARAIALRGAVARDIRSDASLDRKAVTIHGIGEQRAALGENLEDVLADLVGALAGRVLVAHAAGIERSALARAAKAAWGIDLPIRTICTLKLEQRISPRLTHAEAYRLGPVRARYGLPDYAAHDALTDAIAAAELLQAQLSRLPTGTCLDEIED